MVIWNLLQTRKKEVVFVTPGSGHHENWIRLTDQEINDNVEIESKMIPAVIKVHDEWIAKSG